MAHQPAADGFFILEAKVGCKTNVVTFSFRIANLQATGSKWPLPAVVKPSPTKAGRK